MRSFALIVFASLALASSAEDIASSTWERSDRLELKLGAEEPASRPVKASEELAGSVAWSRDGMRLATAGWDGCVRLWDAVKGEEVELLETGSYSAQSVVFGRGDGMLYWAFTDGTIVGYSLVSKETVYRKKAFKAELSAIALTPDGRTLVAAGDRRCVALLEAKTGNEITQVPLGWLATTLTVAPDSRTVALGGRGDCAVVDLATGRVIGLSVATQVLGMAFSPDGRTIVSGDADGDVRLWNASTGRAVLVANLSAQVTAVDFAPDGRTFVTGSETGSIRLWETASGREIRRLEGHRGTVRVLSFSTDGRRVASGDTRGRINLWTLLPGPTAPVPGVPLQASLIWERLGDTHPRRARGAIREAARAGDDFLAYARTQILKDPLFAAPPKKEGQVLRQLVELDDDSSHTRDAATASLQENAADLEAVLVATWREAGSEEAKSRLAVILDELDPMVVADPQVVRWIRVVEALRSMRSDGAREMLKEIEDKALSARLVREAGAGLNEGEVTFR